MRRFLGNRSTFFLFGFRVGRVSHPSRAKLERALAYSTMRFAFRISKTRAETHRGTQPDSLNGRLSPSPRAIAVWRLPAQTPERGERDRNERGAKSGAAVGAAPVAPPRRRRRRARRRARAQRRGGLRFRRCVRVGPQRGRRVVLQNRRLARGAVRARAVRPVVGPPDSRLAVPGSSLVRVGRRRGFRAVPAPVRRRRRRRRARRRRDGDAQLILLGLKFHLDTIRSRTTFEVSYLKVLL